MTGSRCPSIVIFGDSSGHSNRLGTRPIVLKAQVSFSGQQTRALTVNASSTRHPVKLRHLFAFLLALLTSLAWASDAPDLIVERAWLEDASGHLTWEEVRGKEMIPFDGMLAKGYGRAALWVRLRIDPRKAESPETDPVFLRVRPTYLDEVQVYDPLQAPAQLPPVGDRHPLSNLSEPSTNLLLALPRGTQPRDIWVRVQTTSTRIASFEVLEHGSLRLSQARISHLGALYLGVIGAFILWAVVQLTIRPGGLLLSFLFYEVCALLFGVFVLGYAFLYLSDVLPPDLIDLGTSLFGLLGTCAVLVFGYCLLNELDHSPWRNWVFRGTIGLYPLLVLACLADYRVEALQVNMLMILVMPTVVLLMAILGRQDPTPTDSRPDRLPKRIIVGYFVATWLITLLTAAPALGLIAAGQMSLYIILVYSVCSGLLMMVVLQYRAWLDLRQRVKLKTLAEDASLRAAQERAQREDREKLLAMLGHELKTPLATMRMLVAHHDIPDTFARRMEAGISDMTQVLERVIQSGRMEAGSVELSVQPRDLLKLVKSVCNERVDGAPVVARPLGDGPMQVEVDETLVKMIVRNLLDNAHKYGASDQLVTVDVSPPDTAGQWQVMVGNAVGRAGMPDPQKVFQKYYRSPGAGHRSGSGLGLYLVRELARLMGGELRYEPEGSLVKFRLVMRTPMQRTAS